MSASERRYTGGSLCGSLRYEAQGEPLYAGHCYCSDCRKASGSGFVPYMGFASNAVRFSGQMLTFTSKAANGGDAVRNSCPSPHRNLHAQPTRLGRHPAGSYDPRVNAAPWAARASRSTSAGQPCGPPSSNS